MKPIKKLSYKINRKATMGRGLSLLIDSESLIALQENAMPKSEQPWKSKKEIKVNLKNLQATLTKEGEYELLVCSHCNTAADILLEPFAVSFQSDNIILKVYPPSLHAISETHEPLVFSFHRPQYEKTVKAMLSEKL